MSGACIFVMRAQQEETSDPTKTDVPAIVATPAPAAESAYHGFFGDLVSPKALLATAPGTILDQIHPFPAEWGEGTRAVEKRAGSLYAQFVIGDSWNVASAPSTTKARISPAADRAAFSRASPTWLWIQWLRASPMEAVSRPIRCWLTITEAGPSQLYGSRPAFALPDRSSNGEPAMSECARAGT